MPAYTAWLEAGREPSGVGWGESHVRLGPSAPPVATRLSNQLHLNVNRYPKRMCPEEPPSPRSCSLSTLQWPPLINCPLPCTTQASNPKPKGPFLILMLRLSQAIRHFHGSPSLHSNLPTTHQLLCLGEGNSPSLASHSHFPPDLPRGCKANLFLFLALSKASSQSTHLVHLAPANFTKYTACPPAPLVSLPQGLCTGCSLTTSSLKL